MVNEGAQPQFWFDSDIAERHVGFFEEMLHHVKGPLKGRPLLLEEWQKKIVRDIYGWRRAMTAAEISTFKPTPERIERGVRKYRTAYIEIPRKNSKTTMAAGFAIIGLTMDDEGSPEIYSAASEAEQAGIVFEIAKQMVKAEPELASRLECYQYHLMNPGNNGTFKRLSSDAGSKHGFNPSLSIHDEVHTMTSRELIETLRTGMGARLEPLEINITTAGWDRLSVCWEMHEYTRKILDGTIDDPSWYGVIYAAGEEDDWTDEAVWAKCNPNLGVSVSIDFLRQQCKRAKEIPAEENTFRRLYLNQWTRQDVRLIQMEQWRACDLGAVSELSKAERPCWMGLDLATTTDIAAGVLVWPREGGGFDVEARYWIPGDNLTDRVRRDKVPYDVWARQGLLTLTPGNVIDYDFIRRDIVAIGNKYSLQEIAYDPWNATQLVNQLMQDGLRMVPVRQSFAALNEPTKKLLELILSRELNHCGDPVLAWMADNVSARTDPAGNLKPDKSTSTEKIDGIVALIMALSRAMLNTEVGDERGIVFV